MATNGLAGATAVTPAGMIWAKVSQTLRSEFGEATYGSWLAQACLRMDATGALCLVTPTGIARDWIRRYALGRIGELWSTSDPEHRALALKSRLEFESQGGGPAVAIDLATPEPISLDAAPAAAAVSRPARVQGLQERFTFDTFVKGPSNEFALAVARRVASWADGHFNPVIFHGAYGFGKTHLLNALAWEAIQTAPEKKVLYLTAERFLASFVRALMDRKAAEFKDELRSADLLLIDDVHFIGGKHSSEEELFHTLAALMEDGRRVVFSADRAPSALTEIDARLRSHLSAGLVCGIEPADRALRLNILERKAAILTRQQTGAAASVRPEVLAFLADRFTDSVRELEGALNTLIVRAGAGVGGLTLEETQSFLSPHLPGGERRITVDEIQKVTADHFGLKQADLISQRRTRSVARPRQAAMWLAKKLTTRSLPDIGRRFGDRDHTTVLHAVRRIDELRAADAQLARDLEALTRKLRR